ncbi:phosphate acyltransferase, partial [Escherichia coli]|uniref:phosphate acyltransferase n=1 Tax=Escherichia coli TaxID=562 RepID=UPI00227E0A61
MRRALELVREAAPELEIDGEMHGDCALDEALRLRILLSSTLKGEANLLVCPNVDAGNIAYNLLKTAAGGNVAVGPILLGANAPVQLALAGLVNCSVLGHGSLNIAAYSARLLHLVTYLQQLEMESLGKRVGGDGAAVDVPT